jgi:hypothetical protein
MAFRTVKASLLAVIGRVTKPTWALGLSVLTRIRRLGISFGHSGLRGVFECYLGLPSRCSVQPRLSHCGPAALRGDGQSEGGLKIETEEIMGYDYDYEGVVHLLYLHRDVEHGRCGAAIAGGSNEEE